MGFFQDPNGYDTQIKERLVPEGSRVRKVTFYLFYFYSMDCHFLDLRSKKEPFFLLEFLDVLGISGPDSGLPSSRE